MSERQLRGSADAITSFACAACSASASSAGADAATALMDDASAIAATKLSISSAVFRASRGAKRLHSFAPCGRAHAAYSSQRMIRLSTASPIRATDSCITNLSFLSAEVPSTAGSLPNKPYNYLTSTLQNCKVCRGERRRKRKNQSNNAIKGNLRHLKRNFKKT